MNKNVTHFAAEYKVDEIGQKAVDQIPSDRKQFAQKVLAQLSWDITYKKFKG